ncbi:uncharacterized protein BCR38DRAFT_488785 [Pseudomassariella vexata]|uniref:Uncharacterized protein n=1 Tax=Pseudomassariella vexata TaxID=1141098 RepID=A0A1Y2DKV9_9PEZI|nr:uncharacterized protein BCR38DRAFT_488785 [Pseudomassariella vexata]ORY59766.1 hypothetical protein BCR38DRAFT_488785 [Pseudomassariella vexata]
MSVLHASFNGQAALPNIRRLLNPDLFILVCELTPTNLLLTDMTVGTLPGWWFILRRGGLWVSRWDVTLKKTGFVGIDTMTPNISSLLPANLFISHAVDFKIMLLRGPFAAKGRYPAVRTDALAVIGGTTSSMCRQLCFFTAHRFKVK